MILGVWAVMAYLFTVGVGKVSAIEMGWYYYDMHGDVVVATRLIEPVNLLVPFLIMIIFGLAIWRVNKTQEKQERKSENNDVACNSPG